jgi:hypothetical protein
MEIAAARAGIGLERFVRLAFRRCPAAIFFRDLAAVLDHAGKCAGAGTLRRRARYAHPVLLVPLPGSSGKVDRSIRCCNPVERHRVSTSAQWPGASDQGGGDSEMKKSAFLLASFTAFVPSLHADSRHVLHASFPDGTGLEIFSETTGSSQINSTGMMGIGPGPGSEDLVNRLVVDSANNILYAYNLEASRGATPDTVKIRIEPIGPASEAAILQTGAAQGRLRYSGAHLPTVAGVREFPAVKMGEAVTLDILYNPSTGEKVFDVLRPIATAHSGMSVGGAPAREAIAMKEIALRVNGRAISAPASFIIGSAVRLDIPGHGAYVIATYDPHEVSPDYGFAAIAQVDGKTLSWTMGRDRVEITSTMNVLVRSAKGVLWVYHDSHYQPDIVGLQSAERVDWLLPRR